MEYLSSKNQSLYSTNYKFSPKANQYLKINNYSNYYETKNQPNKENYTTLNYKNKFTFEKKDDNNKPSIDNRNFSLDQKKTSFLSQGPFLVDNVNNPTNIITSNNNATYTPTSRNRKNFDTNSIFNSPRLSQHAYKESPAQVNERIIEKIDSVINTQFLKRNLDSFDNLDNQNNKNCFSQVEKYKNLLNSKSNLSSINQESFSLKNFGEDNNTNTFRSQSVSKSGSLLNSYDFSSKQQQQSLSTNKKYQLEKSEDIIMISNTSSSYKKMLESSSLANLNIDDLRETINRKIASHYSTLQSSNEKSLEAKQSITTAATTPITIYSKSPKCKQSPEIEKSFSSKAMIKSRIDDYLDDNIFNQYSIMRDGNKVNTIQHQNHRKEGSVSRIDMDSSKVTKNFSYEKKQIEKYNQDDDNVYLNHDNDKNCGIDHNNSYIGKPLAKKSLFMNQIDSYSTNSFRKTFQAESPKTKNDYSVLLNNYFDDNNKSFYKTFSNINNKNSEQNDSKLKKPSSLLKSVDFEILDQAQETAKEFYFLSQRNKESQQYEGNPLEIKHEEELQRKELEQDRGRQQLFKEYEKYKFDREKDQYKREKEKEFIKDSERATRLVDMYQKELNSMSKPSEKHKFSLMRDSTHQKNSLDHVNIENGHRNEISIGISRSNNNTYTGSNSLKDYVTQVSQGLDFYLPFLINNSKSLIFNDDLGVSLPIKTSTIFATSKTKELSYDQFNIESQSTKHSKYTANIDNNNNNNPELYNDLKQMYTGNQASHYTCRFTVNNQGEVPIFKSNDLHNNDSKEVSRDITYNDQKPNKHSYSSNNNYRHSPYSSHRVYTYYMSNLQNYLTRNDFEDYFSKLYKEHFNQSIQSIQFCKNIKNIDYTGLAKKKVYLPRYDSNKDKKTLIFDLDETLIHCNENPNSPCDIILPIRFPTGEIINAGINIRPYAIECLQELSKHFEIIIFTASHSCYANVVLDHLDPNGQYIHHRLFRENCVSTNEGIYIKDLRIFANRSLKDMAIIDNAVYSFGYQLDNGIPIVPFYCNKSDTELKNLIPYALSLLSAKDIRETNHKTFKFHLYNAYDTTEEIINRLFL